jgi:hypothetical protein
MLRYAADRKYVSMAMSEPVSEDARSVSRVVAASLLPGTRGTFEYMAADRPGLKLKTTLLMLRSTAHCGMTVELLVPLRKARFCQAICLV